MSRSLFMDIQRWDVFSKLDQQIYKFGYGLISKAHKSSIKNPIDLIFSEYGYHLM